jgi:hypothetical protein
VHVYLFEVVGKLGGGLRRLEECTQTVEGMRGSAEDVLAWKGADVGGEVQLAGFEELPEEFRHEVLAGGIRDAALRFREEECVHLVRKVRGELNLYPTVGDGSWSTSHDGSLLFVRGLSGDNVR